MILDICVVLILTLIPMIGWKKGFVLSVFNTISTILCVCISVNTAPILAKFIDGKSDIGRFLTNLSDNAQDIGDLSTIANLFSLDNFSIKTLAQTLIAFLGVFIILKVCLKIVFKTISAIINKLPIANKLNSLLGLTLGVFKAFVFIFICSTTITLLSQVPTLSPTLSQQMKNSNIYPYVSESSNVFVNSIINSLK